MAMSEAAKEARRAYQREWNRKNRDKINAIQRRWRKEHPDEAKAQQERYWERKAAAAAGKVDAFRNGRKPRSPETTP